MNVFIFTGVITRDAKVEEDTGSGVVCGFHVSVSKGKDVPPVWVYCILRGKKAQETAPDLFAGQIVTVEAQITGASDSGAVYVQARSVIPHWLEDEEDEVAA